MCATCKAKVLEGEVDMDLNHALSARRSFTTRQLPLAEVKTVAHGLGGSVNDVVLAAACVANPAA